VKALTWHGRGDIRCDTVPDPKIQDGRDAIIKVTACAICGSDLHLMGGYVPTMEKGDVLGHETMGEVVEVGADAKGKLKVGDRVVVPFTICCGECRQCKWGNWSCCERTNPNAAMQAKVLGFPSAGMFGYSHLTGGIPGGQAEYLRVPYADVGPMKVPEGLTDEQVLFLTDIFPTAYMAADHCEITPEDTIAIWGCGPVGILTIKSCQLLGAKRVIAIDSVPERLALARTAGAETIDSNEHNVHETLMEMTKGQGPDAVIEAVGLESHGANSLVERAAAAVQSTVSAIERPYALNEAIMACRPGGIVSVPGVYIGPVGPVMMGAFMNKSLTMKTGQTHMLRYMEPLLKRIQNGEIDPSFIITHRSTKLEDGPELYETFREKKDGCIKVVMRPHG
jgi:threonine dehydrogenase-like Zn-dependent dehydrogenase